MERLIKVLGEPDIITKNEEGDTVLRWNKGTDRSGQELFFSVETGSSDSEYWYNYTEDDDTEIGDWGEIDDILIYAQRFLKYVQQTAQTKHGR